MSPMRIQLVSDIHLEFYPAKDFALANAGADILVLAGDIGCAREFEKYETFFRRVSDAFPHVLLVIGNHEHYQHIFGQTANIIAHHLDSWALANVHLLDVHHEPAFWYQGVALWGSTLWTDCNHGDRETRHTLARSLNDFRLIRYGEHDHMLPTNAIQQFEGTCEALGTFLKTKSPRQVVVVTHHAPSFRSVDPRYAHDTQMNGGFASNLDSFIESHPEIALWMHGHMHASADYTLGATRVVCNPAGYPIQGTRLAGTPLTENPRFDSGLVIEIPRAERFDE
jgi:Icc-related predicted phosphoesterase